MKKQFYYLAFALVTLFTTSCKKENQKIKKAFTMTSNTWYRFAPTTPSTVNVNGTNFTAFAYVPGGGSGTATDMGNVNTFYNQLAYTSNANVPQPVPEGSVDASVSLVLSFPILGAPLPLIQPNDFTALTNVNSSLQVPATVNGKIVNAVVFNNSGDAIFTTPTSPSVIIPASATRFNFSGKLDVVGGRGKFANATGKMDFTGFFNPSNPNDAGYAFNGMIEY